MYTVSNFLVVSTIIIAVYGVTAYAAPEPIECGNKEYYSLCGYDCFESCEFDPEVGCAEPCQQGCFCLPGYARVGGQCVPQQYCITCGSNEEFRACGPVCEPNCDDMNPSCSGECVSGCFCRAGYVRGPDNNCIKHLLCI